MRHQMTSRIVVAVLFMWLVPSMASVEDEIDTGRKTYEARCMYCHGEEGKGDGVAAAFLDPKPRDFTRGQFKIRSTLSGSLPTDADLLRTVAEGMPGTSMPAWKGVLSGEERRDVVTYIKTFSKRFARQKAPPEEILMGEQIAPTAGSIATGRQLFDDLECWKCHGKEGRGDGPSAPSLVDDWDNPVRPTDLTRPWNFRGGGKDEDIYRTFVSGLAGTPMPSFAEVFETPEEAHEMNWHLVNYVSTLAPEKEKPEVNTVIVPMRIHTEVPLEPSHALWGQAEPYSFPLVGQVIEEPRWFTPSVDRLTVKALRNDVEIGFLLEWHDGTESKAGESNDRKQSYPDAIALQFPVRISEGGAKPHFLMGDGRNPVNLWLWSSSYRSRVVESNAKGMDEVNPQPESPSGAQGYGECEFGKYRVVVKRNLLTDDAAKDIQFEEGRYIPIAFHAWDGSRGETGKQHAISSWYLLYLDPPRPLRSILVPPFIVVLAVGAEVWFIRRTRKKGRR